MIRQRVAMMMASSLLLLVFAGASASADALAPTLFITSPTEAEIVPSTGVIFTGSVSDADGISSVNIYIYDFTRGYTVLGDAASYDASADTWQFNVLSAHITTGAGARFWVQAADGLGRLSSFKFVNVSVSSVVIPDNEPPVVAITQPTPNETISSIGVSFEGTVTDDIAIANVNILIYDYTRGFTVLGESANYDDSTNTWQYDVLETHLTPNAQARFWVQAEDTSGKFSFQKFVDVFVGGIIDTTSPTLSITKPLLWETIPESGALAEGTAFDAGGIKEILVYLYDNGRFLLTVFGEAATYDPGTQMWTFPIDAADITPGDFAQLYVQAIDNSDNSVWETRPFLVDAATDVTPPVVTIDEPTGLTVSSTGATFRGTATDPSGVSQVHINLFSFRVASGFETATFDGPADYDPVTGEWEITIGPEGLIGPGAVAVLSVDATDTLFNFSNIVQKTYDVILPPIELIGPSIVSIDAINGTQLLLDRRERTGRLFGAVPFKLRGVSYSPVDPGETINSLADARTHLRNSRYLEDFPLIAAMNANTIKTYADLGTDTVAIDILNEAYRRDLMVVVTLADLDATQVQTIVEAYRDHPALLAWLIGNEWNLNKFFTFGTVDAAAIAVEATAQLIKTLDPNHPVASSLGFSPSQFNIGPSIITSEFADIVAATPTVDLWGFNVYRSSSFDPLFFEWSQLSNKPLFLSEFGTDDWDGPLSVLDETTQADTQRALWDEIHRKLSAINPVNQVVGGFVFEWNDEWWKMPAGSISVQDDSGNQVLPQVVDPVTALVIAVFPGHPDGFANEEHFGVVDMNRQPKAVYAALQQAFKLGTIQTSPIDLEVVSSTSPTNGYVVFSKRDLPFYARVADVSANRGFHIAVINRSEGTVQSIANFDTVGDPATTCPAMSAYVAAITAGDVVMAAVAQSAVAPGISISDAVMDQCRSALLGIGSIQLLSIGEQKAWAIISIAGTSPIVLAEKVSVITNQTEQVNASVITDADRDGVTDDVDTDNDNDGSLDTTEVINGTDVLDPASN